ncbi:NAD(P)-binding protein [Auricularia subglabra TFB-10046 SS5]|uniref:NAD(P)-binding protein n=1 Tax=Auricularia subglabra (strain TFB-10046 / SS5) TaxID=717982 RepID=J0DAR4_AURST|nr:NAD(P)-binding protein [Auricularia subglabra TFB-10046 SS5]
MSTIFGHSTTGYEVVSAFHSQIQDRACLAVVVTGPTPNGIGASTALSLARGNPSAILLVGRSPAKYTQVADGIRAINPGIKVKTYGVDLGSFASVRAGAAQLLAENDRIDVLINNAGVTSHALEKSADGIELNFATNHIGHFLFTKLLLPTLCKSHNPRIVNLTSSTHAFASGDYDDYNWDNREYVWMQAYAESKLANIHFTQYLAAHGNGIVALSVHPGTIWGTSIFDTISEEEHQRAREYVASLGIKEKTVEQGASTTLVAALDPALETHNGAYMVDCQVAEFDCEAARREDLSEKLWTLSEKLIGEPFRCV